MGIDVNILDLNYHICSVDLMISPFPLSFPFPLPSPPLPPPCLLPSSIFHCSFPQYIPPSFPYHILIPSHLFLTPPCSRPLLVTPDLRPTTRHISTGPVSCSSLSLPPSWGARCGCACVSAPCGSSTHCSFFYSLHWTCSGMCWGDFCMRNSSL